MTSIAATVLQYLKQGESVVLATIIRQQGATPRKTGTQMVVAPGGRFHGTIGGGLLEARVLDHASAVLSGARACIDRFDLDGADAAEADLICGGGLEVFYDPLLPAPETIGLFQRRTELDHQRRTAAFATLIQRRDARITGVYHALLEDDGQWRGELPLNAVALAQVRRTATTARATTTLALQDADLILEPIRPHWRAIVVGAGHVARPTAQLAVLVDFQVTVLDDRASFANRQRFPDAHEVAVVPDFDHIFHNHALDRATFVIIVTRGHLHDQVVLAQVLRTDAGYIGMIGSRRKRDAIYRRLLQQGFVEADLQRVHCPIGLDIDAETPAEIAVSIVAEMIAVRHRSAEHPRGKQQAR